MKNSNRWLDYISGNLDELQSLISEGEHQEQDFKFRVDSSRKIAITLCAFSNTDGGRILIGVKDNGRIAGIDPEEEFYMIEGAANMYCQPPVIFETRVFEDEESRKVLEVYVPPSPLKPHRCQTDEKYWRAFIRQRDENFAINRVISKLLEDKNPVSKRKNIIAYGPEERLLFDFLTQNSQISLSKFARLANISIPDAESILVSFLKWGIIYYEASEKGIRFFLTQDQSA